LFLAAPSWYRAAPTVEDVRGEALRDRTDLGGAPPQQGASSPAAARAATRARRGLPLGVLVLAIVAAFFVLAAIGNVQASRNQRVLPLLDPLIGAVVASVWPILRWLDEQKWLVTAGLTVPLLAGALAGLVRFGRPALALVALAAALGLSAWGQALLLGEHIVPGAALYAAGVLAAIGLGVARPLRSLAGFPPLPGEAEPTSPDSQRSSSSALPSLRAECVILFALTVFGMALRMYAMTELPAGYDHETIGAMMRSRRLHGVRIFMDESLLTTAPGFVHIPTQLASFLLLGTSIYSIRMAAMVWGVAAIPLLYWFVRRMAGVWPAIVATALFVVAPEHIFWARTENTFFAPVAVCALITGHLGLSLALRPSWRTAAAAALWMPFCRYFYIPTLVLFTYPVLVYGHAMVFVKGAWKKAAVVLPMLAAGAALWVFSLSLIFSYLHGRGWKFVHPAIVYGAPAWRKLGESEFQQAGTFDLLWLQAKLIGGNLAEVAAGITYSDPFLFSHWFPRYHFSMAHQTLFVPAFGVLFVVGLGYLIGQLRDRRAAALLLWIGIGLLPAVMSNEPSGRRMAVIFPAVYAVVGLSLAAFHRLLRRFARGLAFAFAAVLAPVMGAIVWLGLASFYLNQTMPVPVGQQARFMAPFFERSDVILSDLEDERHRMFLAFANMDAFLARRPCFEYIARDQWLPGLLQFTCNFGNLAYQLSLTPEEIADRHNAFAAKEVTLLVTHHPGLPDPSPLLRVLFPAAPVGEYRNENDAFAYTSFGVTMEDLRRLRRPSLVARGEAGVGLETMLLQGVTLARTGEENAGREPTAAGAAPEPIVVRGGMYVPFEDSFRFAIDPPCAAAALTVAGIDGSTLRPLPIGVHAFELRLPGRDACRWPLRIQRFAEGRGNLVAVEPWHFASPHAAAQAAAVAAQPS
jgi:hypothetical protein